MSVGFIVCLANSMQRINVSGCQKKGLETNGHVMIAIERPIYLLTLRSVHRIAISVLHYFSFR